MSSRRTPSLRMALFIGSALLALTAFGQTARAVVHFTVTADPRSNHTGFDSTLQAINTLVGGPGAFHVTVGDEDDDITENRVVVDARLGGNYPWFPIIGNHEQETSTEMTWLRAEYNTGNAGRTAIKNYPFGVTSGPLGTTETTYSWNSGNAHFISLNQYWNGGTAAGSDIATDGDVVSQLRTWLAADLAANRDKVTVVFGHEPAFPENRHVGDSLDAHPANRDAFWDLLESENQVAALIVGHTHVYSKHQGDKNGVGDVWQIDAGNAGNGSPYTFVDVSIDGNTVNYRTFDNSGGTFHVVESWNQTVSTVPEPSTIVLAAAGLLALCGMAWRKRRAG